MNFHAALSPTLKRRFLYIQERAPLNAIGWRHGLEAKLRVLERMPGSFEPAPESQDATIEVRQLLYGRYRILYTVRGCTVFVLTVRHGARQFMAPEELEDFT